MRYNFGNIIDTLKESIVYESDFILGRKPTNIIFHGFGIEQVSGLILESIIPNSKAICSEKIEKEVDRNALIIIFSFNGCEDSQDFYRSCIRKGLEVVFLSRNPKIKELCKINKSKFIELPDIKHKELLFLYEALSVINLAIQNNLCEKLELKELIATISKINFDSLIERFKEKILEKNVAFITTAKAKNIAHSWKIFFNKLAREDVLLEDFPNVFYYNLENLNKKDIIIFFITYDESSLTKRKVKHARDLLKIQSTEVSIKGNSIIYKTLVPILLGFLVSVELFYEKRPNDNPFESKDFESFTNNRFF